MSTIDRTELQQLRGLQLPREVADVADEQTLAILEHRHRVGFGRRRGWLVRRLLLVADLLGLVGSFVLAEILFEGWSSWSEYVGFAASLPGWIVAAKLFGLYEKDEERTDHSTVDDLVGVFLLVTVGAFVFSRVGWMTGLYGPDTAKLTVFWATAVVAVTVARVVARTVARQSIGYLQNTIIVGAGDVGQLVARKLLQHPEYGINLLGFVDGEPKERRPGLGHLTLLGTPDQLPELVRSFDVERVIVAFSRDDHQALLALARPLREFGVQVDIVPRLFELIGPKVDVHTLEGVPLLGLAPTHINRSSFLIKRGIDLFGAALAVVMLAPWFVYIAVRIKLDSPGPILFRQKRLGMDMKEFELLKFRTMKVGTSADEHRDFIRASMGSDAETAGNGLFKLDRDHAVTRFGRLLRKTSLDELPQLFNVLRGDMSLVGPRPCLAYETEGFEAHHFERFSVPAGLTGLWQVTARARTPFGEALDMDVAYARSWSLGLDLRLLGRTPLELIRPGTR